MNLTDKQAKTLRALDAQATTGLLASDVTDVVGVLAGIKTVAYIDASWRVRRLLRKLGLKVVTVRRGVVAASFDREAVKQFRRDSQLMFRKPGNDHVVERRIGAALGYPLTATDYFLFRMDVYEKGESLPPTVNTELYKGLVHEAFVQLILSPGHYKDEIMVYARPLEEAVAQYAPRAYAVMTEGEA